MAPRRTYQVKEVAEIAGVSVRTLHHYDTIGLLVPSRRSEAGYRRYDDEDRCHPRQQHSRQSERAGTLIDSLRCARCARSAVREHRPEHFGLGTTPPNTLMPLERAWPIVASRDSDWGGSHSKTFSRSFARGRRSPG